MLSTTELRKQIKEKEDLVVALLLMTCSCVGICAGFVYGIMSFDKRFVEVLLVSTTLIVAATAGFLFFGFCEERSKCQDLRKKLFQREIIEELSKSNAVKTE